MTKTVSLRNVSGEPLVVGDRRVEPDEVVHVEGDLAPKRDQPEDGVVIGTGDTARAYPSSLWRQVGTAKTVEPDVTKPTAFDEGNN